ncbi:universal stress protein [Nonomuraea sp. NPDC000554]|uniref:universal stress protein n=1 Tax=Nonomuraea sp. NPDC000554 TaxID=3154259 RepID=UPI00332E4EB9
MSGVIVAGVDGSAPALAGVEWAADDAFRMRVSLRVVCAVDLWPYPVPELSVPDWEDALFKGAHKVLAEAEATARARQPTVEVSTELLAGPAAAALREQADAAAEIVIGSRGLGGFTGSVLGSISTNVAGHAPGPVVVVRSRATVVHGEIVVGVDGSPGCEPALGYAFEQAALRGSRLRALNTWQLPYAFTPHFPYTVDIDEMRWAQRRVAESQLSPWQDKYPQVTLLKDVQRGHPVEALTLAGDRADLLVVGSHGRSAAGALALGSVSRGVLHHARCTVAVVRA